MTAFLQLYPPTYNFLCDKHRALSKEKHVNTKSEAAPKI